MNEDIIKTMIRSSVPDVPLPPSVKLLITVNKNKMGNQQQGSKSPKIRSQAMTEPKEIEPEGDKAKNHSNRSKGKETEPEEEEEDAINREN